MKSSSLLLACALLAGSVEAAPQPNPLLDAAKNSDVAALRDLVKAKVVDINTAAPDGTTALHWAVNRGNAEAVDLLLAAGANVKAANRYGVMALSLAAERGDAHIIESLLKAGADPNTSMPGGETALMTASRTGNVDAVKVLLVKGANVNARDTSKGQTALMWAAAKNNADAIRMLLEFGADVKARSGKTADSAPRSGSGGSAFYRGEPSSFSAFLFAVRAGQIEAAKALLAGGADVNDKLSDGQSALVISIANGHWELADLLLDRGADPNASDAGWTALHQLIRERRPNVGFGTPGPIPTGTLDSLDLLKKMIAKGVDVNARMTRNGMVDGQRNRLNRLGSTALLLAAKNTDVEAMRVLKAAGADPSIPTADHVTPLMAAAGVMIWNPGEDGGSLAVQEDEQLEAVKLCVDWGNSVNDSDLFGDAPLHGAAYRGNNKIVEFLVSKGAKLDARDNRGWTPLTVANGIKFDCFYKAQPETAALLKQLMQARGLSTEGQVTDGTECLDCFGTHPELARAFAQRVAKQEAEMAKSSAAKKP